MNGPIANHVRHVERRRLQGPESSQELAAGLVGGRGHARYCRLVREAAMISAREALERLREGNRRFASGVRSTDMLASQTRRSELAAGQEPFAIILGCSDSRVPAEIIFDQGLGDLFVIRVAGNIVAASQIGSVEFAADRFGTPLVVVLGHSRCGAVLATLEELMRPREKQSRNLRSIVDRIRPSVEALLATELRHRSGNAAFVSAASKSRSTSRLPSLSASQGNTRASIADQSLQTKTLPGAAINAGRTRRASLRGTATAAGSIAASSE